MDLSVIIVNYNTKKLLQKCLESVFASFNNGELAAQIPSGRASPIKDGREVFVVDNGSSDGSVEMVSSEFSEVKLIKNDKNLGFSKANNLAIRQAKGEYILLLNSDTEVKAETFDLSIKYMIEHPDVGILGCKVLLPDGTLDKAARRKFPNPWNSFLRLFGFRKFSDYNLNAPIDQEMEVDAVMGAYLMTRRSVIDKIGLLDEEYFMYGEDLDWCWEAKQAGHKVVYYPKAEIMHYKYASSQQIPLKIIRMAHKAMKIFYRKHYADQHNWLFNQFVYLGIALRMYLVLLVNLFRTKKSVH